MAAFTPEDIEKITMLFKLHTTLGATEEERGKKEGGGDGRKTLGKDFEKKLPEFREEDKYTNWSFKVKMAIQNADPKLGKIIDETEMREDEVDITELKKEFKEEEKYFVERWSTGLYEILGLKVDGDPLTILRNVSN